jgi:hypothetical protein
MAPTALSTRKRLRRALGSAVLAIVAVSVSLGEGTPHALPGVALGSPILLHAEPALALVAIVIAALSVLGQATRGRLPIELSTSRIRYEAEAADDAATAVTEPQHQLDDLVAIIDARGRPTRRPQRHP